MMFSDQSAINAHYDTAHAQHTKRREPTFECDVCGKKVTTKYSLKQHMSIAHGVGDVQKFECDVCSYVTKDKSNLRKHVKNKHS